MTEAPAAAVRTLIVDDEPLARAGMRRVLDEVEWIEFVGEASNGPRAVELIDSLRPELVFLDIQLPGINGIAVLNSCQHKPFVVFCTAYAQHAVTAFELGALDYVLKPFGAERLRVTLDRVRSAIGEPLPSTLDRLSAAFAQGPLSRLFARNGRAIVPIAVDAVDCFEAVGDYVAVHSGEATHLLHLSLNRLEERLDPLRFHRIHRTHIVNLDRVATFRRLLNGQLVAEMQNGKVLAVSRSKAQELRGLAR